MRFFVICQRRLFVGNYLQETQQDSSQITMIKINGQTNRKTFRRALKLEVGIVIFHYYCPSGIST